MIFTGVIRLAFVFMFTLVMPPDGNADSSAHKLVTNDLSAVQRYHLKSTSMVDMHLIFQTERLNYMYVAN